MQLSLLVQALESCLLEPPAAYIDQQSMDHWMLRQFAAHLLAKIIRFLSLSLSLSLSLFLSLSLSLSQCAGLYTVLQTQCPLLQTINVNFCKLFFYTPLWQFWEQNQEKSKAHVKVLLRVEECIMCAFWTYPQSVKAIYDLVHATIITSKILTESDRNVIEIIIFEILQPFDITTSLKFG